jgi:uncharacterized membrane protein YphA (DoxX/SURF4 family)
MSWTRTTVLATAALMFLRIVIGLHFFLEGASHLRDPAWSSAGFRKAAVGPLADFLRADLPEVGDWSQTLGDASASAADDVAGAADSWRASVASGWRRLWQRRLEVLAPAGWAADAEAAAAAEAAVEEADRKLAEMLADDRDDLLEYRRQLRRLAEMQASPMARDLPYVQKRIADKRRELESQAAGWMSQAAAIGSEVVTDWDRPLSAAQRRLAATAVEPTRLWKADRFVSWALVTIGAGLVLGLLTKFHAVGGICFLLSVVASQPFWLPAARATYEQWVEIAGLLVLASVPTGGWTGLDYFLMPLVKGCCPLSGRRRDIS